jgi:protein TonB
MIIPDILPEIDLTRPPTTDDDFRNTTAPRMPGGSGTSGTAQPENRTFSEYEVEKPAMSVPGTAAPRYPDILKAAGVEGDVVISFVVDTTGRVDMSRVVVLKSSHSLFDAAVRAALPAMRFLPAEVGGRKVRQLVQQPFVFHIVR